MKPTISEIKAAAEAAISARQAATDAKAAADAAGGTDTDLNADVTETERVATEAEGKALALSHNPPAPTAEDAEKKKQKLLRKRSFIDKDLEALGVDPDEEADNDEEADLDKPLTRRDLQAIEAGKARVTANQMAEDIADPLDKEAVKQALARVVPSGNPEKDFTDAVAIANIERNSKILEEIGRRPVGRTKPTGTGAPPNRQEAFVPTAQEQVFMRAPFNLTKDAILKARAPKA